MTPETKERNQSVGGHTETSVDSNTQASSQIGRVLEPVGRNGMEAEMAIMLKQRMKQDGRFGYLPSMASSVNSSVWSSTQGDSEDSETYAWSVSLNSDSSDDSDSSSYSSEYVSSSAEEEEDVVPPLGGSQQFPQTLRPGAKKYPQPPTYMTGSLLSSNKNYPQPPGHMMKRPDKTLRQPPATAGAIPGEKVYPQPPPGMEGLPFGMEGFNLESLKRDLEKVGRAILSSNAGELAAERAQTLASINWLASHLPNAVLDQLGHETRQMVGKETNERVDDEKISEDSLVASVVESDAMSEVSELSQEQLNLDDFGLDVANSIPSNGAERPKQKQADRKEEDLPGGIPYLLSPRPSPTKKKKSIKKLNLDAGGAFDFGTAESCTGELADSNSISVSRSLDANNEEERVPGGKSNEGQIRGKHLPFSSDYRCALLFVDISGFTRLSTKLDPEALSKVRNLMYAVAAISRKTLASGYSL